MEYPVLESFLPKNAARLIQQNSLYDGSSHVFNFQTVNMNELQLRCSELERQLEEAAKKLQKLLDQMKHKTEHTALLLWKPVLVD